MEQQNTENIIDDLLFPKQDAESEKTGTTEQCPKCQQLFKNKQALRMHDARVHTKKLGSGYKWKTNNSEAARKARRRESQRKLRERYKLQGRDSRGYLREKPAGRREWTTERLMKFQNTMRRKAREKSKRIKYVYPEPRGNLAEIAQPTATKAVMRYCPYCGENIERHIV